MTECVPSSEQLDEFSAPADSAIANAGEKVAAVAEVVPAPLAVTAMVVTDEKASEVAEVVEVAAAPPAASSALITDNKPFEVADFAEVAAATPAAASTVITEETSCEAAEVTAEAAPASVTASATGMADDKPVVVAEVAQQSSDATATVVEDEKASEFADCGDPPPRWHLPNACGPRWLSSTLCSFRVWAPHGEGVVVEIEDKVSKAVCELPLAREGDFWSGETNAEPGCRYRIAMGSSWNDCFDTEGARLLRRDPYARESDFESTWCILHPPIRPLPPFPACPKFNELIIYEIHLGSFAPADREGSAYAFATEKLDYIAGLGFNCIQLMPTAEFGGLWGYNSRQLLNVHGPWGSAADLKVLISKAHSLGVAVLFDLVLNHGSSKKNTLWNWDGFGPNNCGGIFFEGEKDTPWGKRFAFQKPEVQDYLKQACRVAVEEYGVDGLRFDSVHNMPWWLLQQMTGEFKKHYPDKILIAEITPENPKVISDGGFHSCWLHATHFDSLKIMKKYDGGEDPGKKLGMLKNMVKPNGFPNIGGVHSVLGSHDQVGDRHNGNEDGGKHRYYISRLGGRGNWHARAQCRAWFAFQNCCRGLPMTFMGSETLQEGWWHIDAHSRFNWGLAESSNEDVVQMRRFVTASNRLRLEAPGLVYDDVRYVHEDKANSILGFLRGSSMENVCLCIVHLAEVQWEKSDYGISTGFGGGTKWKLALNSQDGPFGGWDGSGTAEAWADGSGKISISIPKWSCLIYRPCSN